MRKTAISTMVLLLLTLVSTGWCSEERRYSAAVESVDCLVRYYSKLENISAGMDTIKARVDYTALLDYARKNHSRIIQAVYAADAGRDISRADRIFRELSGSRASGHAYNRTTPLEATGNAYYDRITGHTYIKKYDGAYAEYNRKGSFFRMVPSTQPHLAGSTYVHPITDDTYLLYTKNTEKGKTYLLLPSGTAHPCEGWALEKALCSMD